MAYFDYDMEQTFSCFKEYLLFLFVLICFMYYTKYTSLLTPAPEEGIQRRPRYHHYTLGAYYNSWQKGRLKKDRNKNQYPPAVSTGISHESTPPVSEEFSFSNKDISQSHSSENHSHKISSSSINENERDKESHFDDEHFGEVSLVPDDAISPDLDNESVTVPQQKMVPTHEQNDRDKRVPEKMYRNSDCRRWTFS